MRIPIGQVTAEGGQLHIAGIGGATAFQIPDVPEGTYEVGAVVQDGGGGLRFVDVYVVKYAKPEDITVVGQVPVNGPMMFCDGARAEGWSQQDVARIQLDAHPHGVAMLPADGGTVCCFSAPNGTYPVSVMKDGTGRLVGIRVDLSGEAGAGLDPASVEAEVASLDAAKANMASMAGHAMVGAAASYASNSAQRAITAKLKEYIPRVFWPLIPGQRGSVTENLKRDASRRIWGAITGCGCSVAFFLLFASAFGGILLIVIGAIVAR